MDEKHPLEQNKQAHKAPVTPKAEGAKSRRIFSKRWVYPAIYLGAAAIIIGLMYVKSQVGTSPVTSNAVDATGTDVGTSAAETFQWPVSSATQPKVTVGFFNAKGSTQQQAAALVFYDNGYYAHQGYDIQSQDKKPFAVVAALSGKVTAVSNNPLQGQIVEVTSAGGYVEEYESLGAVSVKAGDAVKQGQELGTAGTSEFEKSQGNHLYFQVSKDGAVVDPGSVLPKLQ